MRTVLVIPQLKYRVNLMSVIRTAEAFGVSELCIIGNKNLLNKWKVGKVCTKAFRHIKREFFDDVDDCLNYLLGQRLKILCIENSDNATLLPNYKFPSNIALVMGHENAGVPTELLDMFDVVKIPQYGLVGCLNTSTATSIVLYERFKDKLKI